MLRSRAPKPLAILVCIAVSAGCVHAARVHNGLADPARSLSVGSPSFGFLIRPTTIPARGAGYELFRTRSRGGEVWGTDHLVTVVRDAARYVLRHAPPGAPLRVGDLSALRGGHIDRHASHRNGRDVDLLFFARDERDASVPTPAFIHYGPNGQARDPMQTLHFDVERNWLLVEALARDTDAGVIRIFVSAPLRALLLAWARAHGRDGDAIARAEHLLSQPGDSAPHDDHFHVRVACGPEERVLGCRDGGPVWWWLEKQWGKTDSAPADDETALAILFDELPDAVDVALADGSASGATSAIVSSCVPSLLTMRSPLGFRHRMSDDLDRDGRLGLCR